MRCKHFPPSDVVKCEHKELKAKDFILEFIETSDVSPGTPVAGTRTFALLARSPESPIAAALQGLGPSLCGAGIKVKAIFSYFGASKAALSWTGADQGIAFARELAWARAPAFIDAHEQLVLGPTTSWIGDCMRRDPSKTDSFECFAADHDYVAHCAALSFKRIWLACEPVVNLTGARSGDARAALSAGRLGPPELAALEEAAGNHGRIGATRH